MPADSKYCQENFATPQLLIKEKTVTVAGRAEGRLHRGPSCLPKATAWSGLSHTDLNIHTASKSSKG